MSAAHRLQAPPAGAFLAVLLHRACRVAITTPFLSCYSHSVAAEDHPWYHAFQESIGETPATGATGGGDDDDVVLEETRGGNLAANHKCPISGKDVRTELPPFDSIALLCCPAAAQSAAQKQDCAQSCPSCVQLLELEDPVQDEKGYVYEKRFITDTLHKSGGRMQCPVPGAYCCGQLGFFACKCRCFWLAVLCL
jgi:hypothetical protein